jgi:hypothetical protein
MFSPNAFTLVPLTFGYACLPSPADGGDDQDDDDEPDVAVHYSMFALRCIQFMQKFMDEGIFN